jgi:hypothetical protein
MQQMAGEIALGAGATVVLVTGSGLSGFGSAPALAHAATPPVAIAEVSTDGSAPAWLGGASPRVDSVHDWARRTGSPESPATTVALMLPASTDLLATPTPSTDTPLPLPAPSRPSLGDASRQLSKTLPATPSTAVLSSTLAGVAAPSVPVSGNSALPLLSK